MSATVLVHLTIKDAEKFKAYGAAAGPTIKAHGGTFAGRFGVDEVLAGEFDHKIFAIITFPSVEAAIGWYRSPEYQDLIPNRDEAADMVLVLGAPPA